MMSDSPPQPPYLVCEVANVHGGDRSHLDRLMDVFKGLDYPNKGIKFQVFSAEGIALPDYEWFPVYQQLFFDESTWWEVIGKAGQWGDVWLDVFDPYGAAVLQNNLESVHGIKLQASVLENLEVRHLLAGVDLSNKRLMVNISGFTVEQIADFVEHFSDLCGNLVLQVGYQSYPTAIAHTGLQKIPELRSAFPGIPLCFADHADAETEFAELVPVYAAMMDCALLEKHFCVSRSESPYDAYSSVEPAQLQRICDRLRDAVAANQGEFVCGAEADYLTNSIQIPVLNKNAGAGTLVAASDVVYRRTSQTGLPMREIVELQGSRMVLGGGKKSDSSVERRDFKKARVAVIVAGRMKSSRLPSKAALPIAGVSSVERCLEQCLGVRGIDEVVLATSWLEEDAILETHTLGGRARCSRGHPDDVIVRYLDACDKYEIDVVIRVTADCPLVLPEILEYLLQCHFRAGADYTGAEKCAAGTGGEIINVEALRRVIEYLGSAKYSEYMTWYFKNNPDIFKVNVVSLPAELVRDYRVTLDYSEDLKMFEQLFARMTPKGVKPADEVFSILDSHPEIAAINSGRTLKYVTDKELVETLNRETRITVN